MPREWPEVFDELEDMITSTAEQLATVATQTKRQALADAAKRRYGG